MGTILIKGGRFISPAEQLDECTDLIIEGDRISQLGEITGLAPEQVIDATGMWVLPSLVDLSHALREPGLEHKATIAGECDAAARGGFGALCCPPCTIPVNDSAAVTNFMLDQAAAVGNLRIYPVGAMTKQLKGEQLSEMNALREAGCIGVTNLRKPFKDLQVARRCLEYACSQGIKVIVCPQDFALASDGCAHDGAIASRLGLTSIPAVAESIEVAQWLILAEETHATIHFAQLSTARAVEMIGEARARGLAITADVALANLCFTDRMLEGYNPMYHVEPPLRSESDRRALLEGVNQGVIDAICSHHQPHEQASKQAPFAETSSGMSQAELVLPQLLALITKGELNLERAVDAITAGPARAMDIEAPGIANGKLANLVIVNPEMNWTVDPDQLISAGKNTPLLGTEVVGKAVSTLFKGDVVWSESSLTIS